MKDPEQPASVLIVDDTVENLRLLSNLLGRQGYQVRPVTSGRQALQAVEHDPPDLVLLDINMPEMDGYEVCRRLKARDALRHIPVIFLTALTDTADKVRAFDAGGVDYVSKPFQFEEVLARVRTHVTLRRAQQDLSQSYQRLRSLEAMRDDLVHMVVHDMRSSLMVLNLTLELLEEDVPALVGSRCSRELAKASAAARILTGMANDLLDVSRMEEAGIPLQRSPCDLAGVAREVAERLAGLDPGRSLEVESPGPLEVDCDGRLIARVLENLMVNGIKHTPAGGRLRTCLCRRNGMVRLEVQDEGPGIPPEAQEKIFEKFGAVEARSHGAYHSAGLGLAFCRLAVEAHGGAIGVESRTGEGSTFWVELPRTGPAHREIG